MNDRDVRAAVLTVLRAWGLQADLPRFVSCADGLALAAHLANAGAKFLDSSLYDEKPLLVAAAAEAHPFAWQRERIVYIETCVGQVSFHVFDDDDALPERDEATAPWAGGWMQDGALLMARAFLDPDELPEYDRWLMSEQPVCGRVRRAPLPRWWRREVF